MSRLSRIVLAGCTLLACLAGAGAGGCGLFKASTPECVDDGNPPCTGSHCEALRSACDKQARVCKRKRGECDIELCARSAAQQIGKHPEQAEATEDKLLACVANEVACERIDTCFEALDDLDECEETRLERRTETQPILPTHVTDGDGAGIAGLVVLPGDDLGCLRCAFQPGSCGEQHPGCFSANPASAGATDSCLDYRVCLRTCEQTAGDNARAYAQCATSACDGTEHAQGKLEFAAYRSCMFERCATCFTPAR